MKRDRFRNSSLESWQIDAEKLDEGVTAYGGLPMVVETWYGLGLHKACERHLKLRERQKGLSDAQWAEVVTMLLMAGGRSVEDVESLKADTGLCRLWPMIQQATPRSMLNYLHRFHDPEQPDSRQGKARIGKESNGLRGLGKVNRELIGHVQRQAPEQQATIDIDASIHESHKKEALWTYDGVRGYQPVIAYWAEQGVILADQFRDGNVPAAMGNRGVVRAALSALPEGVEKRYVRGDSALYEQKLLRDLDGDGIAFGISADVSKELREAMRSLPEKAWNPYMKTQAGKPDKPTGKQWAEVPFVPEERSPKKDARPFRYVGIRIPRKVAMAKIGLPDFIRARPHTFRMRLLQVAGRVISHSRRLSMRMGAHGHFARDVLRGYERDLDLALA